MKRRFLLVGFLFLAFVSVFAGFFLVENMISLTGKAIFDSSVLNVDIVADSFEYDENLNIGCFVSGGESMGPNSNYRYFWEKNGEQFFVEEEIVLEGIVPFFKSTEGNVKTAVSDNGGIFFLYESYNDGDSLVNSTHMRYAYINGNKELKRMASYSFYRNQTYNVFEIVDDMVFIASNNIYDSLYGGEDAIIVQASDFLLDEAAIVGSDEILVSKLNGLEIDSNFNFYVFGEDEVGDEKNLVVSKINSSGNFSWNFVYGQNSSYNEEVYDVAFGNEGQVFVLGAVKDDMFSETKVLLELDKNGSLVSEVLYPISSVGEGQLERSSSFLFFFNEEVDKKNPVLVSVNNEREIVFNKSVLNQINLSFSSFAEYTLKDFVIDDDYILQAVFSVNDSGEKSSLYMELDFNGNVTYYSINKGYDLGVSEVVIDGNRIVSSLKWNDSGNVRLLPRIYYNYFVSEDGAPVRGSNITFSDVSVNDTLRCEAYAFNIINNTKTASFSDSVRISDLTKEVSEDTGRSSRSGGGSVVSVNPEISEEPSIPMEEDSASKESSFLLIDINESFSEVNLIPKSEIEKEEESKYSFSDLFDNAFDRFFYTKQINDCENRNYEWNGKLNVCLNPNIRVTSNVFSAIRKVVDNFDLTKKDFFIVDSVLLYRCEGCFELNCEYNFERKVFRMFNWNIEEIDKCIPITCADEGRQCGEISDGCGNVLSCGKCDDSYNCFSGRCVPLNFNYCDDSDYGESFSSFGLVRDKYSINEDYCLDSNVLVEGICKDGEYDFVEFECLGGCKDGICLGDSCQDSDPENNIFVKGVLNSGGNIYEDECSSDVLVQYDCSLDAKVKSSNIKCIFGCINGTCIKGSCLDADGNNSNVKSYVIDNNGKIEDYCSNDITLVEGGCLQNSFGQGEEYSSEMIFCSNGCKDGRCIPVVKNCEDNDGMNFYSQGTINFKDPNGIMRSRKDTCTNTTAYIGLSVGSGKYVNEFDCPFEKQNIFPYYGGTIYECPNGCMNGKCLPPVEEASYCNENYCKLYEGEYLVFDDYLALSTDYIYTNDYLIINYDYNYSYPAKTSLNFMVGDGFNLRSGELNEKNDYFYDFSDNDYYEMNIEILNIVGVRDFETIYDTVSKPYVEISFDFGRMPLIERSVSKPVLKSSF